MFPSYHPSSARSGRPPTPCQLVISPPVTWLPPLSRQADYDKMMSTDQFKASKRYHEFFLQAFLSPRFFSDFAGLGFSEINPKEKEINSLTQTVFYSSELMSRQAWRMEYELLWLHLVSYPWLSPHYGYP